MERLVEIKVNEFCEYLNRSKQHSGQMKVRFFEKKETGFVWKMFGSQDDKVCWEEWMVQMRLVAQQSSNAAPAEADAPPAENPLGAALADAIQYITAAVNQKKEHIPPVPKELTGLQSFYHEVKVVPETSGSNLSTFVQEVAGAKLI